MIYVSFACLANIMHAFLPDRQTTVEKGYIPLFNVLDEYKEVNCEIFFSGVTSEWLNERYPEFVSRIRRGIESGKYRLGSCSYSMPRITSLSMESTIQQVREGHNADERIWGQRCKGFWPPLYVVDPALMKVLSDEMFQWVFLSVENISNACNQAPYYPSPQELDMYLPFKASGLGNGSIIGVPCCSTGNFLLLKDRKNLDNTLETIRSQKREYPPLLVLDIDAEVCLANEYCGVAKNTADSLRKTIESILNITDIRITSIDSYLDLCPVRQELFIPPESSHFPPTAEKLYRLSDEAELIIREAERFVNARGNCSCEMKGKLAKAWKLLLVSQNADARLLDGDAGIPWRANPPLIKQCMEAALEAKTIGETLWKNNK